MSDSGVEGIEPIIDYTNPRKSNRESVIDFTKSPQNNKEPVIDFTQDKRKGVKHAPDRKLKGVVGGNSEPALARMARAKSLRLALAALGAAGTIKSLAASDSNTDIGESGAIVSHVQPELSTAPLELVREKAGYFDEIFHDLDAVEYEKTRETVDDFKDRIAAKSNYVEVHRNIPLEYRHTIEQTAKMYGISIDTLMGIISVENGGGPAVMNESSGALGVAQFLPDTVRQYGLKVNSVFDERGRALEKYSCGGKISRRAQEAL